VGCVMGGGGEDGGSLKSNQCTTSIWKAHCEGNMILSISFFFNKDPSHFK
jgi:hypothetical protein